VWCFDSARGAEAVLPALERQAAEGGLGDRVVRRVRSEVGPGTSALFVVSTAAVADRLERELAAPGVRVIRSALARPEADYLRETLAEESVSRIE
jgi:uncharacterized membrane protein